MPSKKAKDVHHAVDISKNPYQVTTETLSNLIDPKNPALLKELGGVEGLMAKLKVDKAKGLIETDNEEKIADDIDHYGPYNSLLHHEQRPFDKRRLWYGENFIPPVPGKTLISIVLDAFSDRMLQILMVIATISTVLGILQAQNVIPTENAGYHTAPWAEGVAIFIAVIVVVLVGSLNDFQKEVQFRKLSAKKEDREIKVLRDGISKIISAKDVVVGDVVELEPGDLILVDGVFLSGYNLKCDESTATGESDLIKKGHEHDLIMISGSKVAEGVGKYLVTGVGVNSFHGKTMMALIVEEKPTPLEEKLLKLTEIIAKLGVAAGIILFLALLLKLLITEAVGNKFKDPAAVGIGFLGIFTETITIIVVAVPEGLPLAVTLALVYAGKRMIKDNNFVRIISACEVMGHATTICSDKTGTLTQNKMTVVSGTIAKSTSWDEQKDQEASKTVDRRIWDILMESIAVNSSAFEEESATEKGKRVFVGNKTETALLGWQKKYGVMFKEIRDSSKIATQFPFSSERKSMSTIVKKTNEDGSIFYRLHTKGASEIVYKFCQNIASGASTEPVSPEVTQDITKLITRYAEQALRTISLAYRDFSEQEYAELNLTDGGDPPTSQMTLVAIVGIEDPLRVGVNEAVKKCQKAGVIVRMVTGDNVVTAKAIATKCGIYVKGGVVLEGPKFRKLSEQEMERIIPKLQVLARSSPLDKQLLVEKLKKMGEVVAVTGDGTNDGAALKTADVGFSMGISGTEVAKEASSIILMDDNFSSIVRALMWGRTVNDAVKKFLQFQLTVNVTAVVVTFITGIAGVAPALGAIQLLWINLIMDSFAALALATENPSLDVLDRYPESKTAPLITFNMWKMIIAQSLYQIVISCTVSFAGPLLFIGKPQSEISVQEQLEINGIVFNTFVFLQLFNEIKYILIYIVAED
eukprot:NODE_405_length_7994_cov_0.788600.p1 type:complete len:924 gc:universal NODE_405_length_7994_cov_0.788600:2848-5619(+)